MEESMALDLGRSMLSTALMIVAPILLVGLLTGLLVSLFQTVTALQEQTLAIVPKMLAIAATIWFLMPWILKRLRDFALSILAELAEFGAL